MAEKIAHHFNPRLSLRKFRDPALEGYDIWQYELGIIPTPVLIAKAGMQPHYNTVVLAESGAENTTIIEDALGEYETAAGQVLKAIENGKHITPLQKLKFAEFLSLQLTRPPIFRDWIVEKGKETFGIEFSPDLALGFLDTKHSHFVNDVKWEVLIAPASRRFVTSDNPFSIHRRPAFTGWLYPVSPKIALTSSPDEDCVRHLKPEHVDQVNLWIVQAAQRFVYASQNSESLQKMVQEHINTNPYLF